MTEKEALAYERQVILEYRKTNQCCCNFDDGGRNGGRALGKNNGMYGKTHSDEVKKFLKEINSDGRHKGKNNTQYGISPKERMDEETYKIWREKQHARKFGEANPNYGNRKLSKIYKENPNLSKEKQSRPRAQNGRARTVFLYSSNEIFLKKFDCVIECAEYMNKLGFSNAKPKVIATGIYTAIAKNKLYLNHKYSYEKLHQEVCNMSIPSQAEEEILLKV